MHEFEITKKTGVLSTYTMLVLVSSFAALALTIGLSASGSELKERAAGYALVIAAYLVASALVYRWHARQQAEKAKSAFEGSVDRFLNELDETNRLLAGSLKVPDMFRLVASRIDQLVGCSSSVLFLIDPSRSGLEIAASYGTNQKFLEAAKIMVRDALFDRCMKERSVVTTSSFDSLRWFGIPLTRGAEPFGVLQIYFDREPKRPLDEMQEVFEAIGVRVSPVVLSSMVFERNRERALTDELTDLPNERAFHLILEQRIAETERDRDSRPLSILSINIRDFDLIGSSRGNVTADVVLNFVARTTRENLRQMDFFARCRNDEFLAVLPTASEETVQEIVERIESAFSANYADGHSAGSFEVRLNFGWAEFGKNGETPKSLLAAARARRMASSGNGPRGTLLMFRK